MTNLHDVLTTHALADGSTDVGGTAPMVRGSLAGRYGWVGGSGTAAHLTVSGDFRRCAADARQP
jgi:hypothetical protein